MFLRFVSVILILELLILHTQASLYVQHNVYANEPERVGILLNSHLSSGNNLSLDDTDYPSYIEIKKLNIYAPIEEGYIKKDNIWKVYLDKLSYAEGLGTIKNRFSNIVLYGHATDKLLGNLHNIKKGDKITIFGYHNEYQYKVISKEKILPDEPDKLLSLGDTNLSLFTCDGDEDEYRLLIKSKLVKIDALPWKEVRNINEAE